MHLAFYRGPGDMITHAIRHITHGPYSHVELLFPNGWCFSASGHLGNAGVRWDRKDSMDEWDLVPLPGVTDRQVKAAIQYSNEMTCLKFDWAGMAGFVFPWIEDNPCQWYCSEICLAIMQDCFGMFVGKCRKIDPNTLYTLVQSLNA